MIKKREKWKNNELNKLEKECTPITSVSVIVICDKAERFQHFPM
jgi:hypothetical protein